MVDNLLHRSSVGTSGKLLISRSQVRALPVQLFRGLQNVTDLLSPDGGNVRLLRVRFENGLDTSSSDFRYECGAVLLGKK